MSGQRFSAIPWQAAQDNQLTELQLRVLIMLGKYADETGWCFPYQKKIAEQLGCTPKAICTSIRALVESGYVEKAHAADLEQGSNPPKLNNNAKVYRVILDRPENFVLTSEGKDGFNRCGADHMNTPYNTPDSSVSKDTGPEGPKGNQKKENHLTTEEPPTMSKQAWDLGTEILPGNKHRSLIGKWIKQAGGGEDGAAAVLAVLKSCQASGTRDPISYITAAMNKEHGEPPEKIDPRKYGREKWEQCCDLLMKRGRFYDAFKDDREHAEFVVWVRDNLGPVPGSKGCLMPKDLQTPEVVALFETRGGLL